MVSSSSSTTTSAREKEKWTKLDVQLTLELKVWLKHSTQTFTLSSFPATLANKLSENFSRSATRPTSFLLNWTSQPRLSVRQLSHLNMRTFFITLYQMLRRQSKDLTTKTCLDPPSQFRLKCGSPRKKKSRRESARRTDRLNKLFLLSWVSAPTSSRVVTVAKTSAATREDISSATPIIRTTAVTEVAIAEAEVEEAETVETETSPRELTARMDNNNNSKQLFPFLSQTSRILRN